jgi:ribosomal protein L36
MNTAVEETVSAGHTMRVPVPCKGKCGGWSGPDATFSMNKGRGYPTNRDTITWTKTKTKYYGVKTVPTKATRYKVEVSVKKVPETTKVVTRKKKTTKIVPPKFTPKWTKTVTTIKTWTKYSKSPPHFPPLTHLRAMLTPSPTAATTSTKTVPCKVKTITSLETKTFVETINAPEGGDWDGFHGRATATPATSDAVAPTEALAAEECAECNAAQRDFNWADIAKERAASLAAAATSKTLTGAKFRGA